MESPETCNSELELKTVGDFYRWIYTDTPEEKSVLDALYAKTLTEKKTREEFMSSSHSGLALREQINHNEPVVGNLWLGTTAELIAHLSEFSPNACVYAHPIMGVVVMEKGIAHGRVVIFGEEYRANHLDPEVMYYNHVVNENGNPRELHRLPISSLAAFDALDSQGQAEAIGSARDKISAGALDGHTIGSNCPCDPIRESTGAIPRFIHCQLAVPQ
jgi:hypothetical protein